MLSCPVRDCALPLTRTGPTFACSRGHSFDVARSGYVNLLQPQDKKSKEPGDSKAAVAARRRLHDRGLTAPLLESMAELLSATHNARVLDAGCGEGFYLGSLATRLGWDAHGVDLSAAAIEAAAKRYPTCSWVVANADRRLPYLDGSFDLVLSITGRHNPDEFRRVLRDGESLFLAVPASNDLIELRGPGRDRMSSLIDQFATQFQLRERGNIMHKAAVDAEAVEDFRVAVYRPIHSALLSGEQTITEITQSLDWTLLDAR